MTPRLPPTPFLRRDILGGLGSIAVASMLKAEETWRPPDGLPMIPQRAKRVIWLFMRGGVSHMESFDPKPMVTKYAGKSIGETPYKDVQNPEKLKKVRVVVVNDANGQQRNVIYPLQTGYKRYGECGMEISDWFPHIGSCADDIAFIRSMWTTDDNHGAQVQFHSGRHMLEPRVPTLGAWVTYGLGSMTNNLPSFINMGPRFFDVRDGHYLGPAYDAVNLKVDPKNPLTYAAPEFQIGRQQQEAQFDLIHRLNALNAEQYPGDKTLAARMKSYQLAYNMQTAVPETMNLDAESAETKKLYGMDDKVAEPFARQLIVARRLAERGVRFIQLQHGDGAAGAWDSHSGLKKNHSSLAQQVDKPISGLLKDLKQRGMLDDTLVVFATEFGRTPGTQGSDGRDHHPFGFSVWMAGGGIKGGTIHGSTDELGFHAVEHPHYVTDVHATILHQLGLDPHRLEIPGRKRLERDFGKVIPQILA
ncbi:MAG: DUF1501 domain-containing protein [Prosthecobacter sp.]|uniref:DUF1501 domain-containing protein n=1 Tax=Prosthecobacter sp. TaxID=1965333 RepID=UPI0025DC7F47|nr:DUF1501 domain-containing protein [Prosthecobacter sp.]MCF7784567.1 DUF1501 domain-containing protein [Prosthecobacter sp.]